MKCNLFILFPNQVSPLVVHLNVFKEELLSVAEKSPQIPTNAKEKATKEQRKTDLIWQLFPATRCLIDCES
jgi:hypothetical protein